MADLLPLFPLGTVLFPGVPLPLHIFEERYRTLVRELLDGPDPRWFGVVAIRLGSEVGDDTPEVYDVGCVAVLRRVEAYPDGRYDIVVAGGPRFRLDTVDTERPYLRGAVELLDEERGPDAQLRAAAARAAFTAYWQTLGTARGEDTEIPELPSDPLALSYLISAALQVDVGDKQAMLEAATAASRLTLARRLLRRETALIDRFIVDAPGDELTAGPFSLN